jgi:hypothetical protein
MPFKDKNKKLEYESKWRKENPAYQKVWRQHHQEQTRLYVKNWRDRNKPYVIEKTIAWYKAHPWVVAFNAAKNRCQNPKIHNYHRYGGRGIQLRISKQEVREIWFRDKAWEMNTPTLDRVNNDGNYELSNCRFIPMVENIKKAHRERKAHANRKHMH